MFHYCNDESLSSMAMFVISSQGWILSAFPSRGSLASGTKGSGPRQGTSGDLTVALSGFDVLLCLATSPPFATLFPSLYQRNPLPMEQELQHLAFPFFTFIYADLPMLRCNNESVLGLPMVIWCIPYLIIVRFWNRLARTLFHLLVSLNIICWSVHRLTHY